MSGRPMFPAPYTIRSINTKAYAISTKETKAGDPIATKPGEVDKPKDSVLYTNVPLGEETSKVVEIYGVAPSHLYVKLEGTADEGKLVWSKDKYQWRVTKTSAGTYIITPANGADFFWVNEFNVNYIEVNQKRNVTPPQNEWAIEAQ